jgi:hypothetical protein
MRNAYRILVGNFEIKRPLERSRNNWKDSKRITNFKETG